MSIKDHTMEVVALLTPFANPLEGVRTTALDNGETHLVEAVDWFLGALGHASVIAVNEHASEEYTDVALSELEDALEVLIETMKANNISTNLLTHSEVVYSNVQ